MDAKAPSGRCVMYHHCEGNERLRAAYSKAYETYLKGGSEAEMEAAKSAHTRHGWECIRCRKHYRIKRPVWAR